MSRDMLKKPLKPRTVTAHVLETIDRWRHFAEDVNDRHAHHLDDPMNFMLASVHWGRLDPATLEAVISLVIASQDEKSLAAILSTSNKEREVLASAIADRDADKAGAA